MKKIYYFSKDKLQFVEIKNFRYKLASLFSLAIVIICFILFGGYSYIFYLSNSQRDISTLQNENEILREKLDEFATNYNYINNELDSLILFNKDLRISANLPPISEEVRLLGYGGGPFDNALEFLNTPNIEEIKKASELIDDLTRKVTFEKANYSEIQNKLEENQKLYSSIPAVKPCYGTIAYHGFGMRLHPILHKVRMHEGIDIVTETGTPVMSSGDGKIIFAGRKGSYGLVVEVDHGFGFRTLYAHLSKILVKKGDVVKRKDVIAKTGTTGLSTGPHLHYEVENNGVKQDPMNFIFDDTKLFD